MLRFGMDHQEIATVHAMSYHMVDYKVRSHQVNLRETFPFREDHKMASATV